MAMTGMSSTLTSLSSTPISLAKGLSAASFLFLRKARSEGPSSVPATARVSVHQKYGVVELYLIGL